jgi:flagellar FliL protein
MNVPNSRKFVQFKVAFKTFFGEQIVERVTKHQIAVEAGIIAAAGQFSEEEMTSPEGRIRLAVALRDSINDVLIRNEDFGGIEEVMFTSFVFQ